MYIDKIKPYKGGILLLSSSKFLNVGIPLLAGTGFLAVAIIPPDLPFLVKLLSGVFSLIAFWMTIRGIKQIQMYGGERLATINNNGIELFSNNSTKLIQWKNISGISFVSLVDITTDEESSVGKNYVFIWIKKPLGIRDGVFLKFRNL